MMAQETGEPKVVADLRAELAHETAPKERRALVRQLGLESCVVVPLVSASRMHGMLTLARRGSQRPLGETDLALATEFATRVASMLENSHLHGQVIRAGRVKDEFLGMVSHELRTPLAAVLMWTRALRSASDAATRERAIVAIEDAVRLQARLVEDLVDLTCSFAGKLSLSLGPVDVEEAVANAVETDWPMAAARRIAIVVERARRCGKVWADAQRLAQIVTNLLANAVKFSHEGGRIEVALDCEADEVVLRVRDNGLGISADLLPVVFEPFRRGDDPPLSEHRGAGLGIGLTVVKQLVEMLGGSVSVASGGRGLGAEFTVRLPVLLQHGEALPDDAAVPRG